MSHTSSFEGQGQNDHRISFGTEVTQFPLDSEKFGRVELELIGSTTIPILSRVESSNTKLERILEAGRRFNFLEETWTTENLVKKYDKERKFFLWIFSIASFIALLILFLIILATTFDLSGNEGDERESSLVGSNSRNSHIFYTHFNCMVVSVVIGLPTGMVLYRLIPEAKLWTLKYLHTGVYLFTTCTFTLGLVNMILNHDYFAQYHFVSLHAWLGLIFSFMFLIEFTSGLLFFRTKYTAETVSPMEYPIRFHKCLGQLILIVSVGTWITGFPTPNRKGMLKNSAFSNVVGVLSLIFNILVFVLIFNPGFRRRGRPTLKCIYNNPNNVTCVSSETIVSKTELFSGVKKKIEIGIVKNVHKRS